MLYVMAIFLSMLIWIAQLYDLATHDVLLKISGEWEVAIERFLKKEKGSQRKSRNKAVGGCGGKTFWLIIDLCEYRKKK